MGAEADHAIDPHAPLVEYGLDSLGSMQLVLQLRRELEVQLSLTILYDYPTADALAGHLASVMGEGAAADGAAADGAAANGAAADGGGGGASCDSGEARERWEPSNADASRPSYSRAVAGSGGAEQLQAGAEAAAGETEAAGAARPTNLRLYHLLSPHHEVSAQVLRQALELWLGAVPDQLSKAEWRSKVAALDEEDGSYLALLHELRLAGRPGAAMFISGEATQQALASATLPGSAVTAECLARWLSQRQQQAE
mmetsp:Transcript_15637/g.28002  ORF Transcript_15637/g.28002 Transcript_15637/m.28002 type:complete len:255 (+) Transcript_15637:625-1389(+)